jgi:serine/threonine protein kinase
MERVAGESLEQMLAAGRRFSTREALEILRKIADALDFAHSRGVVHRDIKPANILIEGENTPKIADFGIAKIMALERTRTLTGAMIGTPSYMSPEQVTSLATDGRTDQFAMAVVAFELLTGSRPFEADSMPSLAHQIVYGDRPSARFRNPGLPGAIDAVFRRGLSRLPQDRYPNCLGFIAVLEACWKGRRFDPKAARRVFLWGALASAVLCAGYFSYLEWRSPRSSPRTPTVSPMPMVQSSVSRPKARTAIPRAPIDGKTLRAGGDTSLLPASL